MNLSYTNQWKLVENTVNDRLLDDSLLHTVIADKKIKKQTKTINEKLKKFRSTIKSYKHFVRLKKQAERTCESNDETDDEPGLDFEAFKKFYSQQPKSQLETILGTCTQTPRKPRIRNPQKSNESPTFKHPLSKANVSKNQVKSIEKTSISNSKSLKPELSSTDNNDEKKCIKEIVDELIASNIQKETVDPPLESLAVTVESTDVKDTLMVENLPEELVASELKYDVKDCSKSCYGLENKSEVSNNEREDNCIAICDVTDELSASDPHLNCLEIPNKDILLSQEDIFLSNEKLSLHENLDILNNDEKNINVFYLDSGNHSGSDTNILTDQYPESSVGTTPLLFDYPDEGIIAENCSSINENESIPTDNSLELVNKVTELNQSVDVVSSGNDLNNSQPEVRCKNSMNEAILSDSNLESEISQEIPFAKPICYSHVKEEDATESTANNTKIKLKIRTIEQYNKGYECFSTYQSHKQKKFTTVNNCVENKSPSKHEQSLKPREFSEDFNSPKIESQHLNGLIDHPDFSSSFKSNQENVDESTNNRSSLEVDEQSEGDISEIQSHHLNQSLNSSFSSFSARSCDESFKNSVKTQLLSEIEQRLKDSPTSKNKSSYTQSQKLNGSFHSEKENLLLSFNSNEEDVDDQSFDGQLVIEDDEESLESNTSTTELTSSEIHLQSSDRFSNIEDTLPSCNPTPTKRRISSSEKEQCLLENTICSRKLPRFDEQSTNKQPELISDEHKSQGSDSHEMQLTKEKDDSLIEKRKELDTCKNMESKKKTIPRPRNLEEFVAAEGLTQDITEAHFRLKDIDEDDEIWIMDVPKTINPEDLEDQMILLGGKRELRFGDECYKISGKPTKGICNFSCIFTTSRRKKQYKIVNIEPKGNIKFRKKLSVVPEVELIHSKVPAVPFPKNLKMRHPLFGAAYEDKI